MIWRNLRLRRSPFLTMVGMTIADLGIGAVYTFGPRQWTSTSSLTVTRELAPMWLWGIAFMVLGVGIGAVGFTSHYRLWRMIAIAGTTMVVAWALCYWMTAVAGKLTGGAGLALPAFFALMHYVVATEVRFMREGPRDQL